MDEKNFNDMVKKLHSLGITNNQKDYNNEVDFSMKPLGENFQIDRKPSLPQINSKLNARLCLTANQRLSNSRKSQFFNERSFSTNNLMHTNPGIKLFSSTNLQIPIESRGSQQAVTIEREPELNEYETFQSSVVPEELNKTQVKPGFSLPLILPFERASINRDLLTVEEPPSTINFREPRGSIEQMKKAKNRFSNLSDKVLKPSVSSERNKKMLKSAPQSGRNSKNFSGEDVLIDGCQQQPRQQLSQDSGLSSTVLVPPHSSHEPGTSSGSTLMLGSVSPTSSEMFSEASDSQRNSYHAGNEMFFLEATEKPLQYDTLKNPTCRDNSDAVGSTRPVVQINSEEDQIEFLRNVSKNISEMSYSTKEIIRFYLPDGTFTSQVIDKVHTAVSVCESLRAKFNRGYRVFCQLIEVINAEYLERALEDHECILDVFYSWHKEHLCNRFIFIENPYAFKIFSQPSMFQEEMECDFELTGVMWLKEARGKWRKCNCFILGSMVYYTLKPGSKDYNDLLCLVNMKNYDFYSSSDINRTKKVFKSPTQELIVFKCDKLEHKSTEHPCIAPSTPVQKQKWTEALRIAKFGFKQLKANYIGHEKSFLTPSSTEITPPTSLHIGRITTENVG